MRCILNEWGRFQSFESIRPQLDREIDVLVNRTLKRTCEDISMKGKREIEKYVEDFFANAEDLLMKYVPDFDSSSFVRSIQNETNVSIEDNDLFRTSPSENKKDIFDHILDIYNAFSLGLYGRFVNCISHTEVLNKNMERVNEISREFNPRPYLEVAFSNKDNVINTIKERFINELIEPLQKQIEDIRTNIKNKEQEIKDSEAKREELEGKKKLIEGQINDLTVLRSEIL